MKKIFKFLIVFMIIFFAAVLVGKNFIAKTAVTSGIKAVTGLQMDIDKMDVGLLSTMVGIYGMTLQNPSDYSDRVMVHLPEIYVDYALNAFLQGKTHLEEVRIDLKELHVIRDKDGKLNIESLKVAKKEKEAGEPGEKEKTEIKIDILDLKIGEVSYKDFTLGREPKPLKYNVNLHEKFHNITDLNEMGKLILVKALMNTNIAKLANFDIDSLKSGISETLKKATDVTKPVQEVGEKASEAVEEMTDDIKEKLKLPFGK
jgi:uncharacterized protein involved in outer membrane biogenesis